MCEERSLEELEQHTDSFQAEEDKVQVDIHKEVVQAGILAEDIDEVQVGILAEDIDEVQVGILEEDKEEVARAEILEEDKEEAVPEGILAEDKEEEVPEGILAEDSVEFDQADILEEDMAVEVPEAYSDSFLFIIQTNFTFMTSKLLILL